MMSRHELHRGPAEHTDLPAHHSRHELLSHFQPSHARQAYASENERIQTSRSADKILKGNGPDLTIVGDSGPSRPTRSYLATGDIAAKYESKNNPGIVNRDPNRSAGHDFGSWQFNSKARIPQQYVKWAKENDPETYSALKDHTGSVHRGSKGSFGRAWREHASHNAETFNDSQRRFALDHYLKPLQDKFPRLANDQALQEHAFATAIQSGVGGASRLLRRAGFDQEDKSSQELISNLTEARTKAYKRNARRYASEGRDIEELSASNKTKRIDKTAFLNFA